MPRLNRRGPTGTGPMTGRQLGRCAGNDTGFAGRRFENFKLSNKFQMRLGKGLGLGGYKGRNKGGAVGPGGYCLCAKCGHKVPHEQGVKCTEIKCPKCGHIMVREELVKNKKN